MGRKRGSKNRKNESTSIMDGPIAGKSEYLEKEYICGKILFD